MHKIILDTDPGIDDAIAICYALTHPQIEVLALTTIYGNVTTELATQNALKLCELNDHAVPVATGAAIPLTIKPNPVADFVHGTNGFGEIELASPSLKPVDASAAELMVELISKHPGEVTLVAVGPLTNLAIALDLDPDITGKVKEIVVMGGAFHCNGNVSEHAEANIWNDPHAAQQVLTADWPVVVHGLDVTYQISFSADYLDSIASTSPTVGGFLKEAAKFYSKFYKTQHDFDGCCPHDQLALSYLCNPEWYTVEQGVLDVVTEGDALGKTTIQFNENSNKSIAVKVCHESLLKDYADIVSKAV